MTTSQQKSIIGRVLLLLAVFVALPAIYYYQGENISGYASSWVSEPYEELREEYKRAQAETKAFVTRIEEVAKRMRRQEFSKANLQAINIYVEELAKVTEVETAAANKLQAHPDYVEGDVARLRLADLKVLRLAVADSVSIIQASEISQYTGDSKTIAESSSEFAHQIEQW